MLLISKDKSLIRTISQELPQWGVNVSSIINLKNIYQKVEQKPPDILLLDGDMKISDAEMPSILKLKQLKDRPSLIVCIGTQIDQCFGIISEEMENLYFISKPVLTRSLLSLIDDILRGEKDTRPLLKKELLASERRRHIRAKVKFPLSCLFLNKQETPPELHQIRGRARDISCQGMMLDIRKEISLPPVIDLEFSLPPLGSTLMVSGEIRWKRAGKLPRQQYMGLKFKNLSKRSQNLITRYVYSAISK